MRWTGRTRDIMLPDINQCRNCHSPQTNVRYDCMACHLYHDPLPCLGQGGVFPLDGTQVKPLAWRDLVAQSAADPRE